MQHHQTGDTDHRGRSTRRKRTLRRLTAALVLALGLGAGTACQSIADALDDEEGMARAHEVNAKRREERAVKKYLRDN